MTKQTADDLRAARKLIERPDCWTKGAMARTKHGNDCQYSYAKASCWCADGALSKRVSGDDNRYMRACLALNAIARADGQRSFVGFNDAPTTTHADILALFDRAIAAEEASP